MMKLTKMKFKLTWKWDSAKQKFVCKHCGYATLKLPEIKNHTPCSWKENYDSKEELI